MPSLTSVRDLLLPAVHAAEAKIHPTKRIELDLRCDFIKERLVLKAYSFINNRFAESYINPAADLEPMIEEYKSGLGRVIAEVQRKKTTNDTLE